ncbi:hypothetical protein lbkm_1256 [Lachnospiraceae bacterium KM106-2]|nr:hypothetical protein lbkm_1256 [Lachnospiraceae bacterium KM106-2]
MTCHEAQSNIIKYVNGQLDIETLDEFLNHMRNCDDCMEELEVYYVLLIGMKQLDEDKNLSSNFHADLEESLISSREKVMLYKYHWVRRRFLLLLTVLLFSIVICLGNDYQIKHPIYYKEDGNSDYTIMNYFYKGKMDQLDKELIHYHTVEGAYLAPLPDNDLLGNDED